MCSLTITDYQDSVYQLSLNEQENYILVDMINLYISNKIKIWSVSQKINVDCS
ncbi:unnamed protein product [Paramecium sonneborni]|uniref:Uncharacterized protein n=1 Tax=Paramecium sonneborni TaxID=65129 RepID=A0A8S1RNK7_9CILI|nr:unnamed protein product [Paramecium sonneborni]